MREEVKFLILGGLFQVFGEGGRYTQRQKGHVFEPLGSFENEVVIVN